MNRILGYFSYGYFHLSNILFVFFCFFFVEIYLYVKMFFSIILKVFGHVKVHTFIGITLFT